MDTSLSYFVLSYEDSGATGSGYNVKNVTHEDSLDTVLNEPPRAPSPLLQPDDVLDELLSTAGVDHLGETPKNVTQPICCSFCNKTFDKIWKYYGHLGVHSKNNLWLCDKCPDVRFATKRQLVEHCIEAHDQVSVTCPYCPMGFKTAWRLQQHILSKHINYRSHKCNECDKSFVKPSDLKKHQETHSDVRKHACPHCSSRFKDKSNLKRHILMHLDTKQFVCLWCGHKYQQIASLNRHQKKCAPKTKAEGESSQSNPQSQIRRNHCRNCGKTFKYKSALLEHCVRAHANSKEEDKSVEIKRDKEKEEANTRDETRDETNTIAALDDILSTNNNYSTTESNDIQNNCDVTVFNQLQSQPVDNNPDSLLQIEFLKEMNQLHTLDDELFYNDMMDFDFQPSNVFGNDYDYGSTDPNSGILFDFADNGRLDQDFINSLYHVKGKEMTDDVINVPEGTVKDVVPEVREKVPPTPTETPVAVNECATIFERDVDLEESTNLAENLNQLIGENNVQYISTEDDDTFIISLNSTIDAEQLTDMLNIGIEYVDENKADMERKIPAKPEVVDVPEKEDKKEKEVKKENLYTCKTCKKRFNKKDNYKSHVATHEPSLRRHACPVCRERFSYRSTLNKHIRARHIPRVEAAYTCHICDKQYKAAWLVKNHIERDHEGKTPFACNVEGCTKKFYKKFDLVIHKRFHFGDKAYECDICHKKFEHASHLKRHIKKTDCTKRIKKPFLLKKSSTPTKADAKPTTTLYQVVPTFINTTVHAPVVLTRVLACSR